MKRRTVLGNEGVIGGAEVDEPVPVMGVGEGDGGGVEGVGDHGGTAVGDEVGFGDKADVAEEPEGGVAVEVGGEEVAFLGGGVAVEVEDVAVAGMVEGGEGAEEGGGVAGGGGDEVGEDGGERGGGREGKRVELGLDEG